MSKKPKFPMEIQSGSVTVKIYKVRNKERASYTVSYFADRKRKLKMFADFEEAKAEASSVAKSMAKGELDVLHLRSTDRRAYVSAIKILRPTGVPLELVAKEYAAAFEILGSRNSLVEAAREYAKRNLHKLPHKLVPDAVKEMLISKEQEGASDEYLKVLRVYLNQFAESFHCALLSLTSGQISDFLRETKVSARSKNNARQTLGAFFKFCKERGWLPKDHDGITLVPKFKEAPGEIEVFTPSEISTLLSYARPELIPFLTIGAFAGLRSAEIERLDWKEIHLAEGFIEVKAAKAKTASRRLVPIPPNLKAWLAPHVCETGPVVPFENMSKQIAWLVKDAKKGLNEEKKMTGHDPKKAELRWKKNGLRHSFISYRVAEIQNVNQVALECGNSSAIIFRHYRELVRPADAAKWFAIQPDANPTITAIPTQEASVAA